MIDFKGLMNKVFTEKETKSTVSISYKVVYGAGVRLFLGGDIGVVHYPFGSIIKQEDLCGTKKRDIWLDITDLIRKGHIVKVEQ